MAPTSLEIPPAADIAPPAISPAIMRPTPAAVWPIPPKASVMPFILLDTSSLPKRAPMLSPNSVKAGAKSWTAFPIPSIPPARSPLRSFSIALPNWSSSKRKGERLPSSPRIFFSASPNALTSSGDFSSSSNCFSLMPRERICPRVIPEPPRR